MKLRVNLKPEEEQPALKAAYRAGYPSIGQWCLAMIREALVAQEAADEEHRHRGRIVQDTIKRAARGNRE